MLVNRADSPMVMAAEFMVILLGFLAVAERRIGLSEPAMWRRPPLSAVAVWGSVAVVSGLQFVVPGWLDALQGSAHEVLHHGQVWRLLTSIFVQDGGVSGTIFNLAILAVAAVPAARYFGGPTTWTIFLGIGVAFNLIGAAYGWSGAGNSGATLGLACALVGHTAAALLRDRHLFDRRTAALCAIPPIVGALAWAFVDYHGESEVVGWLFGVAIGLAVPQRFPLLRTRAALVPA